MKDLRFIIEDFTKISSFRMKGLDQREKPFFVPDVDERFFAQSGYRIVFDRVDDNDFVLYLDRMNKARVDLDILALTQDYYLKLAKEKQRKENEERKAYYIAKYGEEDGKRYYRGKRITVFKDNKMSSFQMQVFRDRFLDRGTAWGIFGKHIEELNQKLSDLELETLDNENTHSKGERTSYGDCNLSDILLEKYGVRIKRQNGKPVTFTESDKIQDSLDKIFKVFGDVSPVFRQYGLKISFAGSKMMHARKAIGIFYNAYKAIGTSESDMTQTLAHEIAHFMDCYTGHSKGRKRIYSSDEAGSRERTLSTIFRRNMNKPQKSNYQKRTKECFARAFEQFFNPAMGEVDNYCKPEIFEAEVKPLITSFIEDFNKLAEELRGEQITKEETPLHNEEEKTAASVPSKPIPLNPEQLTLF